MGYIYNDSASRSLWKKVTAEDKKLARKIYNTCKKSHNKKESFLLKRPNIVLNALSIIYFPYDDNDGVTWYDEYEKDDNGVTEIKISIKKFNILIARNDEVSRELKRIKLYLKLGQNIAPEEKIRRIHDYICEDVDFDWDYKEKVCLHDAMLSHKAVCEGYSMFFKALCDISNVYCEMVANENHAWNRVKIDGHWYYFDITWNDINNHMKYYMLKDEDFKKIHPWHKLICYDIWKKD